MSTLLEDLMDISRDMAKNSHGKSCQNELDKDTKLENTENNVVVGTIGKIEEKLHENVESNESTEIADTDLQQNSAKENVCKNQNMSISNTLLDNESDLSSLSCKELNSTNNIETTESKKTENCISSDGKTENGILKNGDVNYGKTSESGINQQKEIENSKSSNEIENESMNGIKKDANFIADDHDKTDKENIQLENDDGHKSEAISEESKILTRIQNGSSKPPTNDLQESSNHEKKVLNGTDISKKSKEGRVVFGIHLAPVDVPWERRMQTLALITFLPGFLALGIFSLLFFVYLFLFTSYWWVSLTYLTWWYADRNTPRNGGRRLDLFRNLGVWKRLSEFFPIKVTRTEYLDPSENYIIACHPHGYLGIGIFSLLCTYGQRWKSLFPGIEPNTISLNSQFILPIYRELLLALGVISTDRESISAVLGPSGKGRAVCLVPGGAREALEAYPGAASVYLQRRKGFCKLALKHGAHLVPVYSFGENDLYNITQRKEGSLRRRLQLWALKILGIAVVAIQGRGVFQYSFGFLPLRRKLNIVVGGPIHVKRSENPTNEEIEELHAKYVKALTNLYDDHKHELSKRPHVPLSVI